MIARQRAKHRAETVGVFPVKELVLRQLGRDRCRLIGGGTQDLQAEPFVHHQPLALPAGLKPRDLVLPRATFQQVGQGADRFSHVIGRQMGCTQRC